MLCSAQPAKLHVSPLKAPSGHQSPAGSDDALIESNGSRCSWLVCIKLPQAYFPLHKVVWRISEVVR